MGMGGPQRSDEGGEEGLFAEINITPLTDIFLVLLIIFMVTSSVIASDSAQRSGVKVNLPKGAAQEVSPGAHDLTVAIAEDGQLVLEGKTISAEALGQRFASARAEDPETQVIVQADAATQHGRVVGVMELAKAAGLRRLAIATRHKP